MSESAWIGPALGIVGGIAAAATTGVFVTRRDREARRAKERSEAVDEYKNLVADYRTEIDRFRHERDEDRERISHLEQRVAAAEAEVERCELLRDTLQRQVDGFAAQLAEAGLLDRRRSNIGPPPGDKDRRQKP